MKGSFISNLIYTFISNSSVYCKCNINSNKFKLNSNIKSNGAILSFKNDKS